MSNLGGESETTKEKHQLLLYEELFSDRFSDNDAEYMRTSQQGERLPPCVENWYTRPKRTFDWTRQGTDDLRRSSLFSRHLINIGSITISCSCKKVKVAHLSDY